MKTIRKALNRSYTEEAGGISAEFVAVLIIVAAIIAAVWAANIHGRVQTCANHAEQQLFSGNTGDPSCPGGGGGDEGGDEGGDD